MCPPVNALGQPIGEPVALALPRPLPPRSPMQGRYAAVVPVDVAAHAPALFAAYAADTEGRIWTYLGYGPFRDLPAFRAWMTGTCLGDDPLFHTILDRQGLPAGLASYLRITPAAASIEVGHINLSPGLQRSAAATEAMYLMMARAFDELGYRRYEWKCDALNAASRRAALRLGFVYEGTFRKAAVVKGRNRDTAWYAITDTDWPAVKARFQAWLAPANFDETGQQRRKLAQPGAGIRPLAPGQS